MTLRDRIAVVAGASRGCGRGIALALGDAGASVYVTGRSARGGPRPVDQAPGTVEDTAEEVTRRGGSGIPVCVDHTNPAQVQDLFARVPRDRGRLDICACAVWGGNERYLDPVWQRPVWEQPVEAWQEFLGAGPYAFWLAAREALRIMAGQRSGLVIAVTEPILEGAPEEHAAQDFSHLAHYSLNRLVGSFAREARPAGVAVIGLMPGFMKTERNQMHMSTFSDDDRAQCRDDLSESTEYSGRAVAALAADANVLAKSGSLLYAADLAEAYGFTDVDGKRVGNFFRTLGLIP